MASSSPDLVTEESNPLCTQILTPNSYSTPPTTPTLSSPPTTTPGIQISKELILKGVEPPKSIQSEMDLNNVDYLVDGVTIDDVELASDELVRRLILYPSQVPERWLDLKMLAQTGDVFPAHIPQLSDCQFLPKPLRILVRRSLELLQGADRVPPDWARLVDPPPVLPKQREMILLENAAVQIEAMGWSDTVKLVKTVRMDLYALLLSVSWKAEDNVDDGNSILLSLCPIESDLELRNLGSLAPLLPVLDDNLIFLYWNARGLARPSFEKHIQLLIRQHQPHIIIISETRVSAKNTEEIIGKFPLFKWEITEPVGFLGGIVILWDSRAVTLEPLIELCSEFKGVVHGSFY